MFKKYLPFLISLLTITAYSQTPCSGGTAGGYPCDDLTLQSYMSSNTFRKGGDSFIEAQDSWGWTDTLNNKEYAIVALDVGTVFVDITDPVNPIYVGRLDSHTGSSLWRDVKVYQDHAYIVSDSNGNHGMQVYDMTQLESIGSPPNTNLSETAWITWGTSGSNRGRAHNIVINEDTGFAYVVGVSPYNSGGPVFIDLSTPASPVVVGAYSSQGYCHDAQVVTYNGPDTEHVGKEIMIGSFSSSDFVRVIDVTNKSSISTLSSIGYTGKQYTHQGWFTEDQKYFIVGDELDEQNAGYNTRTLVFDMTDLDNPSLHYTYTSSFSAIDHNGYVRGNRYYLANYRAGMRVLRVDGLYDGTPSMTEDAYFDTYPSNNNTGFDGVWNVYPYFESGNLVVTGFGGAGTDGDGGLFIVKDPDYDNTPPTTVCQNITATLNRTTGSVTITALDVDGGSTDDFGIVSRSIDIDTFTCDDLGPNMVTLTTVDDYGNESSCTATVTVVGETTQYLGGTSWTNGTPDIGSNARISAVDYLTGTGGNISACSCEVDSGRTLTVEAGDHIEITKDITVNGSLIVNHTGSVVQTDDNASVINNGTINVLLDTPNLASRDFMIMGAPMDSETRGGVWNSAFLVLEHLTGNFVPNPDVALAFPGAENFADDNYDNWQQMNLPDPLNPAEGFLVRPQSGYGQPGGVFNYTYGTGGGTLNNGQYNFNVLYNTPGPTAADNKNASPNVMANPFPCPIFADDLINANAMIQEVFFWEHLTPPSPSLPGAGSMNFSMEDISMYNLSGGVGAGNPEIVATRPNGYISTGQGFGIKASASGTAVFNNSMRRTTNNNTLRNQDKERIWLQIVDTEYQMGGATLLAFNENTTAGLDSGYDSRRLAKVVSVYTHLADGTQELGIQSREAFEPGIQVPVGYSTQLDANLSYKISIERLEGENLENATVYLIDNITGGIHNLSESAYAFSSDKGTFNNRFMLQFEMEDILGPGENSLSNVVIYPNPAQDILTIVSPNSFIQNVEIYDIRGRRMEQPVPNNKNTCTMDVSSLETAMYFVKITTESGSITKKLITK